MGKGDHVPHNHGDKIFTTSLFLQEHAPLTNGVGQLDLDHQYPLGANIHVLLKENNGIPGVVGGSLVL